MMTPVQRCSICGGTFTGYGNDPAPVVNDLGARCCDICNQSVVIPARVARRDAKREGSGGALQ
jgi:hypothetical protein